MRIAYIDESGDDGFPLTSSKLFVLTTLYLHYLNWKTIHDSIVTFRRAIKNAFNLPIRVEFHTREFLLNKNPYQRFGYSDPQRVQVMDGFCDLLGSLDVSILNTVIVKPRITSPSYPVLNNALTYTIQRIERDLDPATHPENRFMILSDEGRIGKMRKTTRKIQRILLTPSKFGPYPYRNEIKSLIEDPLPKESSESYLIQLADLVSYVVYLFAANETGCCPYPTRLPGVVNPVKVTDWMNRIDPRINHSASSHRYGIVYHPK
ncbi:MAG: DUF3800 domain-containing protein [Spirochaetia bacterium]|jgi:hypothetical protein